MAVVFAGFSAILDTAYDFYCDINQSTLSGAIDIIVVEHPDGRMLCSPFHVRFGKLQLLRPQERVVTVSVNGRVIPELRMQVSDAGEALFVLDAPPPPPSPPPPPPPPQAPPSPPSEQVQARDPDQPSTLSNVEDAGMQNYHTLDHDAALSADYTQAISNDEERESVLIQKSKVLTSEVEAPSPVLNALSNHDSSVPFHASPTSNTTEAEAELEAKSSSDQNLLRQPNALRPTLPNFDQSSFIAINEELQQQAFSPTPTVLNKTPTLSPVQNTLEADASEERDIDACTDTDAEADCTTTATVTPTATPSTLFASLSFPRSPSINRQSPPNVDLLSVADAGRSPSNNIPLPESGNCKVDAPDAAFSPSKMPAPSTNESTFTSCEASLDRLVYNGEHMFIRTAVGDSSASQLEQNEIHRIRVNSAPPRQSVLGFFNDDSSVENEDINTDNAASTINKKHAVVPSIRSPLSDFLDEEKNDVSQGSSSNVETKKSRVRRSRSVSLDLSVHRNDLEKEANSAESSAPTAFDETAYKPSLSLCGYSSTLTHEEFRKHEISFEQFGEAPNNVLASPDLVVRLRDGSFLPWAVALPVITSTFFFQQPLNSEIINKLHEAHVFVKKDNASAKKLPEKLPPPEIIAREETKSESGWRKWWRRASLMTPTSPAPAPAVSGSANVLRQNDKQQIDQASQELCNLLPCASEPENVKARRRVRGDRRLRSRLLTTEQLKLMGLRRGVNVVSFRVHNTAECSSRIFLWGATERVVISDIDGTITKSDALGHFFTMVGRDWTHSGVASLYTAIRANGYQILYLSARALGQAQSTRNYLSKVEQGEYQLPEGPVFLSPDRLFAALAREVIKKRPEEFKIACLQNIMSLFNQKCASGGEETSYNPFYAGFGNRTTDAMSYSAVGIPASRIFSICPTGEVRRERLEGFRATYFSLKDLVDHIFPPLRPTRSPTDVEFNDWNFWKPAIPELTEEDIEADARAAAAADTLQAAESGSDPPKRAAGKASSNSKAQRAAETATTSKAAASKSLAEAAKPSTTKSDDVPQRARRSIFRTIGSSIASRVTSSGSASAAASAVTADLTASRNSSGSQNISGPTPPLPKAAAPATSTKAASSLAAAAVAAAAAQTTAHAPATNTAAATAPVTATATATATACSSSSHRENTGTTSPASTRPPD